MNEAQWKARIAAAYPGHDIDALRFVPVTASVTVPSEADVARLRQAAGKLVEARIPDVGTDGKPSRLLVNAWLAHADIPNRNGDMFLAADLEQAAASLAKAPDFLVMDWNHSAAMPWREGPKTIGVWYDAVWAFDEQANAGAGAWGVRAQGMMWAWLYPEQATAMLADQATKGFSEFSMACLPKGISLMKDDKGAPYTIVHEPVFFTLSALDMPAADPDAKGKLEHNIAMSTTASTVAATWQWDNATSTNVIWQGGPYTPAPAVIAAALKEARMEEKIAELAASLAKAEQALVAADAASDELSEKVTKLEAEVAERETVIAALKNQIVELEGHATVLTGKVAELETSLATYVSKEQELAAKERLAARKAELPAEFVAAHEARSEELREKVEARWASMDDAEWEEYKTNDLLFGFTQLKSAGYVQRSETEGRLPQTTPVSSDISSRAARLLK